MARNTQEIHAKWNEEDRDTVSKRAKGLSWTLDPKEDNNRTNVSPVVFTV